MFRPPENYLSKNRHLEGMSRADEIYRRIEPSIRQHKGKFVLIEPETGDYFVGETEEEAYLNARRKHPTKKFVFKRIGFRYTYFVGAVPR